MKRSVRVSALDSKTGMTCAEIIEACMGAPGTMVPKVEIGFNARVKAILFEVEVDTTTPGPSDGN